jgi:hypothetical protein
VFFLFALLHVIQWVVSAKLDAIHNH